MPAPSVTIRFENPQAFLGLDGVVDYQNASIKGVSVITSGLSAEGHNLEVDGTTVKQLHELAKKMKQVQVCLGHKGEVDDVDGYLHNFRVEGTKLRADWDLLKTHPKTPAMLERADRQPSTFGLSVSFKGPPEGVLFMGKKCARAETLLSVDAVRRPAANPDGLFSSKDNAVTLQTIHDNLIKLSRGEPIEEELTTQENSNTPTQPPTNMEPTLAQVLAAVQALGQRLDTSETTQRQIVDHINGQIQQSQQGEDGEYTDEQVAQLEQLYQASDEQLAEVGLTRAEVNSAVQAYNATLGGSEGDPNDPGDGDLGPGAEEGALAGAAAGGGGAEGSAAFSALARQVTNLTSIIRRQQLQEKQNAENHQFEAIEHNFEAVVAQRDQLVQFADALVADNEALRMYVRTGTRPAKAQTLNGNRMFSADIDGELHPFQEMMLAAKEKDPKLTDGGAIMLCSKAPGGAALHADWIAFTAKNQRGVIHA